MPKKKPSKSKVLFTYYKVESEMYSRNLPSGRRVWTYYCVERHNITEKEIAFTRMQRFERAIHRGSEVECENKLVKLIARKEKDAPTGKHKVVKREYEVKVERHYVGYTGYGHTYATHKLVRNMQVKQNVNYASIEDRIKVVHRGTKEECKIRVVALMDEVKEKLNE